MKQVVKDWPLPVDAGIGGIGGIGVGGGDPIDARDPDMWRVLFLDTSIPIDDGAKALLLRSMQRRSRRWLLPFLRPLAKAAIAFFAFLRMLVPNGLAMPRFLHWLIYRGLRRWVAPEANRLILRHFHIGSELLTFIKDNVPGFDAETVPLRPRTLADLKDNAFVQHDINLYILVGRLGEHLRRTGGRIRRPARVDFSAITDGPFDIAPLPEAGTNRIDLQSAIEAYTPLYQLFLRDKDYWRASNSLQLDEVIAIYIARIIGSESHLAFVNNGHPLIPMSTLGAGWRLMLHGLSAEQLHYRLRLLKRAQAQKAA